MIYALLFWEFFKIGLFAIGGGLVTIPFLFDLTEKYNWFTARELTDMIAVSQSTPGPMGINMATYAGYNAAGIGGGIIATLAEVLPSVIIVYFIAEIMQHWANNYLIKKIFADVKPAVLALILYAGIGIAEISVQSLNSLIFLAVLITGMRLYKINPLFYIIISALPGLFIKF